MYDLNFFFGKSPKKSIKKDSPFTYHKSQRNHTDTLLAFVRHCDYKSIFDVDDWICVSRSSHTGKTIALNRLEKYKNQHLHVDNVWGFLQFQDNCWFNALLMCLLFSDRMRDIMNDLRKKWILYSGTDYKKQKLYHIFTYLMEIPHYNEELIKEIDSNVILHKLHKYDKSIFTHPGYEGGNGILYCRSLLKFLGLVDYTEIRIIYIEQDDNIYLEIDGIVKQRQSLNRDIHSLIVECIALQRTKAKVLAIYLDIPDRFYFPRKCETNGIKYVLDSIYITNYKNLVSDGHHAIAGLTINKHLFLYDGQRALFEKSLKPYNWKKGETHHKQASFVMSYDKKGVLRYDISKSSRVGFYVLDD